MFIHIVKENENLDNILTSYNVTKNELISLNMHITNWNKLLTGTKLKIPMINENIKEILEESEPFVQEYYDTGLYKDEQKKKSIEKEESKQKEAIIEEKSNALGDDVAEKEKILAENKEEENNVFEEIPKEEILLENKEEVVTESKEEIKSDHIEEYFDVKKNSPVKEVRKVVSPITDNDVVKYAFDDKDLIEYYNYYFYTYYINYFSYEQYVRQVNMTYFSS